MNEFLNDYLNIGNIDAIVVMTQLTNDFAELRRSCGYIGNVYKCSSTSFDLQASKRNLLEVYDIFSAQNLKHFHFISSSLKNFAFQEFLLLVASLVITVLLVVLMNYMIASVSSQMKTFASHLLKIQKLQIEFFLEKMRFLGTNFQKIILM